MNSEEKFDLITRNLQEVVGNDELKTLLDERDLKVYIGMATTGRIHTGYLIPLTKISDFLKAGCKVTILLADIHAFLDNMKSTWEQLELRTQYYEFIIKEALKSLGASVEKLNFVRGSSFQLEKDYTLDMYKIAALSSTRDCTRAGAEVVKQVESPKLSGLIYPILQSLDEQYLDVDAQFGGVDQRKIFMFAREFLPQIGYKKRIHLMNPMLPGLSGGKMSSSEAASKIDLFDSAEDVKKKLNKAFCEEGKVEDNGVLAFARSVVFPNKSTLLIERPEKFGGNLEFSTYDELEKAFVAKDLHPMDLKQAIAKEINVILDPIRAAYDKNKAMKEIVKNAYD
ncbi:tyrosine--tRNA ligase [Candidatus Woesearchaeota archaeon]|jgi:tyrosyl-tRNA synthetase|nr:tyrosine--tRNA ligase [Candidatus Woesearchaeota archaeon]MBT4368161.1 tyrosine--tRNA ligase [Candidatus Woesearchaeota archaeon]MBT4712649.1 tyrosine--tRNA ligase [Candidatus Woesearchaeota archaeon]MBT6639562.1 tyrosine--tRNA ligase [Candidatus Woesearchaeota archaeon]MBT7133734.1 tyrosine--tRNA ligase [Candidatus Woesearchaeota archaeon]